MTLQLLLCAALCTPAMAQGSEHPIETDALREPSFQVGAFFVIQNATVHTATRPEFVGDVYVRDGKIVGVGLWDGPVPDEANTIDGERMHLVPGVVDNHSHMAIERGINESTLSITAEVRIADEVDPDDVGIYRALAGGVTTIRQLHGSANTIGGQDEVLKLRWGTTRRAKDLVFEGAPQGIKFALGENVKRSNRGQQTRFPATRMGVEAVLNRAFARTRQYTAEWQAFEEAKARGENPVPPRKDLRMDALAGVLDGSILVHSHCYRADEILMLIRVSEQFGFHIATLQHVLEGYKVAWEMAQAKVGGSTFSDWWAYKIEAYDAIPQNAALMTAAGVLSSVNSDSDEMIRRLYDEAAKSMRYAGMDAVSALQLVTLNSAIQLGIGERVGSIETGKDADLVLLNGHPMSAFSRVEWTMVDGQVEYSRWDPFDLVGNPAEVTEQVVPERSIELSEAPVIALVGGTIHPMVGDVIEGGSISFQDGVIVDVSTGEPSVEVDQTIDATGHHVWPGMIALQSSLGIYEIGSVRATVDIREIGENQADVRVASSINADSAHIPIARWTGLTRAQVVPGGSGPILGKSSVIDLNGATWEELVQVSEDMLHVRFPRFRNRMPDGEEAQKRAKERDKTRDEALEALSDLVEEARAYSERQADPLAAVPYNPRLEALGPFVRGERKVALHANEAQTILKALEFAGEHSLDAVLYGAKESWKVVDAIAESNVAVVYGPVWALPSSQFDPFDAPFATPAVLARAGIPFAIVCADPENERNLPFHAATAVAYGLPVEEAERAVTLYPARILGLDQELGSLVVGNRADILVTEGHMLEINSKVAHLFIDGEPADHTDNRQTRLYERYRERLEAKQAENR